MTNPIEDKILFRDTSSLAQMEVEMTGAVIERAELPETNKWNVEALYPKTDTWEKDLDLFQKESSQKWPKINFYKGEIGTSSERLKQLLDNYFNSERKIMKLYVYAHLRHDEDVAHEIHKSAYDRISLLFHDFSTATAWIEPEILSLKEDILQKHLVSKDLTEYKTYLERMQRLKPHTLTTQEEELIALAGNALDTPHKAFGVFSNADLKFPAAKDSSGKEHELTEGKYQLYLQNKDRVLRENVFKNLHQTYGQFENTLSELVSGQVQAHLFNARARNYNSCLEAALFPHQIDPEVYYSLIKAVRENLDVLHRYVALRKKMLGVDKLHVYDLYVSMVPDYEMKLTYDEAIHHVLDSVAPLGPEYSQDLEKGLKMDRWVDPYENQRKRSGAYSSGCYDSMPYILMNFHGTLRDLSTLSHEAGHSMHSLHTRRGQPYHYSHYSIFVAEVASTFHEELLFRHLLSKAKSKEEKLYLISGRLDDIRATLFRQALFAEFELKLHQMAEEQIPLTAGQLKKIYLELNRDYYGEDLVLDEEVGMEFLRVPHFYYNFYVYQYSTGISAAYALAKKVLEEGEQARTAYLNFLSSGNSKYPIDLLINAGVDMGTPNPVESLIKYFDELVKEFEMISKETK